MSDFGLALLVGLGVLFFLQKKRALDAEADNIDVKTKVAEIDKELIKTEANLEIEEQKRDSAKKEMEKKTNEPLSPEEIADFFNKPK